MTVTYKNDSKNITTTIYFLSPPNLTFRVTCFRIKESLLRVIITITVERGSVDSSIFNSILAAKLLNR